LLYKSILTAILAAALVPQLFAASVPSLQVRWEPETLVNGAPALLHVIVSTDLKTLSGTWLGHKLYFSFDRTSQTWYSLFGVNLTEATGLYPLRLLGETVTGAALSYEENLSVTNRIYPTVTLKVLHKFTSPNRRQLMRIEKEYILKQKLFASSNNARLWRGGFVAPVKRAISEVFGVNRVFNGELQTRHEGVDYHAVPGTRVVAANSGTVLLARKLFFEGKCVVIDHGQSLMTLYMHLSKFKVREGQKVSRGQLLGRSGATGRVTGPHLHLALRWEDTYLDPTELLKLNLP
jgi:murein DD-endopeptidase MepM/ murein hydrolase activator NlpD